MTKEFLQGYDSLLGTKYLTRIRDNAETAARRYQEDASGDLLPAVDSHYKKITMEDNRAAGNIEMGSPSLLLEFNDKLEEKLNKQIEDQKYYMRIPLQTEYRDRTANRDK